ncbi:DNA polymerase III subunit gamma/tau [Rhodoferax sediminis]|uniref:DNA polymerase III subunit gamma/tau n=1 Tax=Rhodoferax sediminis TaxID=2509614 RepID=A0A515DAQ0_9BURK|nr:DNA polymerase III subunit gamma/tau [Rhodoferax sediminis]QDL37488.1 DNA polymerase III subunit gamma/tau [Rhodoferax sediminis]
MSYLVLARKYRPKTFTELVGQAHVVQALTNALTTQRLHHAYLFTGTRGVGKTTVSRILAKSLNCLGPDGNGGITASPCGVCQACTDIDSGRFVDYTELDAASNRGVDEVQTLLEQAVYKPVQGRFKVFMIDEVHMLTGHAFNAMLKTLEEPPEYLKFVLATTDPQKVPVTVLSRCLQFNLRPMAPETVQEHLGHVLAAEGVPADAPALRLLARAARGSMRDALSLTDQAIAFGSGKLEEATVRLMLGSVDRSYVLRLIEALALGDGKTVVETCEALRLHGLSAASTLEEMSMLLQRMAVIQAVPGLADESFDASDPDAHEAARLAALMPADETQLLYSMCLHGRAELGLAPDEYAALTMVLLRLLAFKPASSAPAEKKTLIDAPTGVPSAAQPVTRAIVPSAPVAAPVATPDVTSDMAPATAPAPVQPPGYVLPVVEPPVSASKPVQALVVPAQSATKVVAVPVRVQAEPGERMQQRQEAHAGARAASASFTATPEGDFWHATVQQLIAEEAIAAMVRELALQSQLVARDGDHWMLRVERESLNQPTSRERLRTALSAAGHVATISVEVGAVSDSPARRNAAAALEKQRAAEEIILADPLVQSMMRDFGAKIVPGSIKPI